MKYIWFHIESILGQYSGEMPLSHFLKNYYKQHPKLGSRDRKMLSEMAYAFHRCQKGLPTALDFPTTLFNCLTHSNQTGYISKLFPDGEPAVVPLNWSAIFPHDIPFSNGITAQNWTTSLCRQPLVFLRLRSNVAANKALLQAQNIPFVALQHNLLSLPSSSAIDKTLPENEYVIQDHSSQFTGTYFTPHKKERWLDICSGAGGKSLMLKDIQSDIDLTVMDIRSSILANLKERFKVYGHIIPHMHVVDATQATALAQTLKTKQFDQIIADVPCSGSGTWARTPEQAYYFQPDSLPSFATKQAQIAINAATYLKNGGHLYYITCSVFKAENEDVVAKILANTPLQLVTSNLINGIDLQADSMYLAKFVKP